MTKELTSANKGANKVKSRAEAKTKAVDLVRREEKAMAMGKRLAMKEGEDYYKAYLKKVEENGSNLEKMDLLDMAIKADDQLAPRGHRAQLRFFMSDYEGAKADAKTWVKMMKKECKKKVENTQIQSLLFQCYLEENNLQAANLILNRDFTKESELYLKHKKEVEEAKINKKK